MNAQRDPVGVQGQNVLGGVVVIRWWAAFASLGAGLIHLAVVSEHVSEWWLYGVFFLVLAVVQMGWAVQAMSGDPLPVPHLFAAMNAAVIGLWFFTRTVGLPIGPEPWQAEAVGTADLLCTVLELVVVVLLVLTIQRPSVHESAPPSHEQRRLIVAGAVAIAAVTLAALVANPPVFGHVHQHGTESALREPAHFQRTRLATVAGE
jgi:hypothetical protein